METVELLPPALCVCGLLANGEPESNLIKTFPVNIKHITDIHATQDLQWPASALCTPHRLRCVHVRLTWNINLLAPVSVCKYSPHPDPPIRAEHNAPIRSHYMATFSWFLLFDFVTAWVSTVLWSLIGVILILLQCLNFSYIEVVNDLCMNG